MQARVRFGTFIFRWCYSPSLKGSIACSRLKRWESENSAGYLQLQFGPLKVKSRGTNGLSPLTENVKSYTQKWLWILKILIKYLRNSSMIKVVQEYNKMVQADTLKVSFSNLIVLGLDILYNSVSPNIILCVYIVVISLSILSLSESITFCW